MQVITDSQAIEQAKGQTVEQAIEQKSVPRNSGQGVIDNSSTGGPQVAFGGGPQNTNEGANPPELTPEEQAKVAGPVFNPEGEAVAFQPNGPVEDQQDAVTPEVEATPAVEEKLLAEAEVITPQNKLHDYSSYTYRTTLYVLSRDDFAEMIEKPLNFVPRHVLISSGGGYPNLDTQPGRHPDFQEDFFIDNLKMTTVVGLNSKTKASNAIDISFTITEPYGMTLLDRLLSACQMPPIDCPNYIEQPYLLEIDFLGNAGEPGPDDSILIDRKRIAIKFLSMKISPSSSGTEYAIQAIPYNHSAFQESSASVPVNLKVIAGTVGEFFDSKNEELVDLFTKEADLADERAEAELQKWLKTQPYDGAGIDAKVKDSMRKSFRKISAVLTNSYPGAFNVHMADLAGSDKNYLYPPNNVSFNIDPLFADSKIVDPKVVEARTFPMNHPDAKPSSSWLPGQIDTGRGKQVVPVAAGTKIVPLIDRIMQASEYITNQVQSFKELVQKVKDKEADKSSLDEYKFLDWYKIVPSVVLGPFDTKRNAYSRFLQYSVLPYKTANSYHPDFKKTKITRKQVARAYNYRYTGQNTDIIALDIDFDSAFYTSITSFKASKTRAGASQGKQDKTDQLTGDDNKATDTDALQRTPSNPPTRLEPAGSNQSASGQANRADDPKSISVSDIANSIYTSSRGDMLNVRMRIIGDPDFIKQDDCYVNPASPQYKDYVDGIDPDGAPTRDDGQILFDRQQVYVQLLTRSAVDIDDETGIVNKQVTLSNGRTTDATFSGVYKILTVDSTFSGGKFEQSLTMIKMPNELYDFGDQTAASSANANAVEIDTTANENTASDESTINYITGTEPVAEQPEQQTSNFLGIQGNDLSKLQQAGNSNPDGTWPIVNGAGTPTVAGQPTQSSPSNVNRSTQQWQATDPRMGPGTSTKRTNAPKPERTGTLRSISGG